MTTSANNPARRQEVARVPGFSHDDVLPRGESETERLVEELSRANAALQQITDTLASSRDLSEIVPRVLEIVTRVFGSPVAGYYSYGPNGMIYLCYWMMEGRLFSPETLLELETVGKHATPKRLAQGFRVSDEYLGCPPSACTRARIVDHHAGTLEPQFDDWLRENDWEMELNVPLVVSGRSIGSLVLCRSAHEPYTASEMSLAETLVKQFTLTVEAARISNEAEKRAIETAVAIEQQAAMKSRAAELASANEALSSRNALLVASAEAVKILLGSSNFEEAVQEAMRLVGQAARLSRVKLILERSEDKHLYHDLAYEWWAEGQSSQTSLGVTRFSNPDIEIYLEPLRRGGAFWHDIEDVPEVLRRPFERVGMISMGIIPIFALQQYVGMIAFDDCVRRRTWTEAEMNALTIAASGLGAAIVQRDAEEKRVETVSRAREQAAQQRAEALAALVKEREEGRRQERVRLSEEMHDGLQQTMAAILLQIGSAKLYAGRAEPNDSLEVALQRAAELAGNGLSEIRETVNNLQALEPLTADRFLSALQQLCLSVDTHNARCSIEVHDAPHFLPETNLNDLYRLLQEAVQNAIKHAHARSIVVRSAEEDEGYQFFVEDDGTGFQPSVVASGMGLKTMLERSRRIGAELNIEERPTGGTMVQVNVPKVR